MVVAVAASDKYEHCHTRILFILFITFGFGKLLMVWVRKDLLKYSVRRYCCGPTILKMMHNSESKYPVNVIFVEIYSPRGKPCVSCKNYNSLFTDVRTAQADLLWNQLHSEIHFLIRTNIMSLKFFAIWNFSNNNWSCYK